MNLEKIFYFLDLHRKKMIPIGIFSVGLITGAILFSSKQEDAFTLISYKGGEVTNVDFANYILKTDVNLKYTNDLIEEKIIELESERLNIKLEDSEKNKVLQELYTSYGGENAFLEYLNYNNLNRDIILEHHYGEAILEKIILADAKYSEKDLEKYFNDNLKEFIKPNAYDYLEIVVSDKATADDIYNRISKGEKFADLARQFSEVSSSSNGGLVSSAYETDIHANVLSKLATLQPNTMSPVFEGGLGYTIVSLIKKTESVSTTFAESKSIVETRYKKKLISENYSSWFDEVKKRYDFSIQNGK